MYYNTTKESGIPLKEYVDSAESQNDFFTGVFMRHTGIIMSASQAMKISQSYGKKWPLTSIRRTLNTLEKRGIITKTDTKRKGIYGRPEYQYKAIERTII